jgi:hypothetical protein
MKRAVWIFLFAAAGLAQEVRREVHTLHAGAPAGVSMMAHPPIASQGNIGFIAHEGFALTPAVKNAPYSAEGVTESVQTLADGNRITRRNTSSLARDSEGRTRRENKLSLIGPWGVEGEPPTIITITDPVSKAHYLLNSKEKTARKVTLPERQAGGGRAPAMAVAGVRVMRHEAGTIAAGPPPHPEMFQVHIREALGQDRKPRQESLGTQVIEGVKAEGTRTVIRIEAGEIGNERPIEVVSERWYSPELQTVVMTKHSDPRFGETTYKLTRIDRREPPPTLFQVPPDYKIVEGGPGPREFIRRPPQ